MDAVGPGPIRGHGCGSSSGPSSGRPSPYPGGVRGRGRGRGRDGSRGGGRFDRAKNDYAQHFVDTGLRPANFIRDSDAGDRFHEYPKLKELASRKDERIAERATPPTSKRVDLRDFDLTSLGTKFDVILIDPPWDEYRRRKAAVGGLMEGEEMEVWSPQEIMDLRIDAVSETASFCFLWSGSGASLQWGRACLRKWGFRRCEDICWIKSNRASGRNTHYLPESVVTPTTEHCLMGIKGTVRRNFDGHLIHANVDTDVMLSEEPPFGSPEKPAELYSIIEHFCNGCRRLELFGGDHNVRRGWLTLGKEISASTHDATTWAAHFKGTVESYNTEGGGTSFLPNHLLGTTAEIEALRPKSPTQLREEASKKTLHEAREKDARERAAAAQEEAAAAEMGIELEPMSEVGGSEQMPDLLHDQHSFYAAPATRRPPPTMPP